MGGVSLKFYTQISKTELTSTFLTYILVGMFINEKNPMNIENTETVHAAFLKAAYFELFGTCPDAAKVNEITTEMKSNGRQESR